MAMLLVIKPSVDDGTSGCQFKFPSKDFFPKVFKYKNQLKIVIKRLDSLDKE